MKKFLLFIIASVMMVSCSQETATLSDPEAALQTEETPLLSTPEGVARAIKAHANFFGKDAKSLSRSAAKCNVRLYGAADSRSQELANPLYIVNFDEGGFAIVSAVRDADSQPYAASETGRFDETGNPVLQGYLLDVASTPVPVNGGHIGGIRDSIKHEMEEELAEFLPPGWYPLHPLPREHKCDTLVRPVYEHKYCTVPIKTKWGQTYPYSKFTLNGYPAGCVAVAMSQMCAYEKYPASVNGFAMDYDAITGAPHASDLKPEHQDQIGHLISEIGKMAGTSYTYNNSLASFEGAKKAFSQLGYEMKEIIRINDCLEYIVNTGNPAFAYATAINNNDLKFAWIIDGASEVLQEEYYHDRKTLNEISHEFTFHGKYFSCNWGMDGVSDGSFLYNRETYSKMSGWRNDWFNFTFRPVSGNPVSYGTDMRILVKEQGSTVAK